MTARRILAVAAHPDDEVLGCGASLARHAAEGNECHVLILAEGMTSRGGGAASAWERELEALRASAREAGRILGVASVELLSFPDNRMDTVALLEVIKAVESKLAAYRPDCIYTHHPGDLNIDHGIAARAVETATRPKGKGSGVATEIYAWETLSATEWAFSQASVPFRPNHFVDVTSTLRAKIEAMRAYRSELGEFPHPRSPEAIEALACYRGAQSGLMAAEAFSLVRRIV